VQATFVPSCSIMYNALTTFEVLHHMHCTKKGIIGEVALNLDISKAFDIVSWSYLQEFICNMSFCTQWVTWMMMYITTMEYHVIFVGDCIGPIVLE